VVCRLYFVRAFAGVEIGVAEPLVAVAVCAFGGEVEVFAGAFVGVLVDGALSAGGGDKSEKEEREEG
jgi:hypothetical protein